MVEGRRVGALHSLGGRQPDRDHALEHRARAQRGVIPKTEWAQKDDGLHITATRAQRIYNDRTWPNPVVLKISHIK